MKSVTPSTTFDIFSNLWKHTKRVVNPFWLNTAIKGISSSILLAMPRRDGVINQAKGQVEGE